MCKSEITKILNEEAKAYFDKLDAQEQEKFILDRVKRSKGFRQTRNRLQSETLFTYNAQGEYVYLESAEQAHREPTQEPPKESSKDKIVSLKGNMFEIMQRILASAESRFRENNLHFCSYGVIHRYKKQILESKKRLESFKHIKIRGLENLKEAFSVADNIKHEQARIQSLYTGLVSHYRANVA